MIAFAVAGGVVLAIGLLALAARRRRRPEPSLRSRLLAAHIAQATTRR